MKISSKYNVAYSIEGKGTTIVLIHGFCESSTMWASMIAEGMSDFQIIRIDLPGFGKSPIDKSYSIKDFGILILNLLEEFGIDNYYLFGHSMGGYIGLSMMDENPKGVLGFGLIHSHPFADNDQTKLHRQKAIDFINTYGSTLYIKQVIPGLFPKSFVNSNRFLLESVVFEASKFPAAGISNALAAMKDRPDQQAVLENIKVPFLSIIGKKDELLPTDQLLKQASMATTTQLDFLPEAGHMGPFEVPRIINRKIKNFIENFPAES